MIKGLEVNSEVEARIWQSFNGWAEHFLKNLRSDGLNYLLSKYQELIESLEANKHDYSYEYINDLSMRNAIQIILDCLPIEEKQKFYSKIEGLDKRLKAQMVTSDFICNEKVIHQYPQAVYWWYYGLPKCIEP